MINQQTCRHAGIARGARAECCAADPVLCERKFDSLPTQHDFFVTPRVRGAAAFVQGAMPDDAGARVGITSRTAQRQRGSSSDSKKKEGPLAMTPRRRSACSPMPRPERGRGRPHRKAASPDLPAVHEWQVNAGGYNSAISSPDSGSDKSAQIEARFRNQKACA